jgi:hypothetical protein
MKAAQDRCARKPPVQNFSEEKELFILSKKHAFSKKQPVAYLPRLRRRLFFLSHTALPLFTTKALPY